MSSEHPSEQSIIAAAVEHPIDKPTPSVIVTAPEPQKIQGGDTPAAASEEELPDGILKPGEDPDDLQSAKESRIQWHEFESQYSLAIQQSAMIERESWGSQLEFLMSCIASAVGLGNIWRFPFICGQNGGAAFLLPYILVLFIVGRPMFLLELGLGQFTSGGPVKVWELCPAFRGVGYASVVASFLLSTFYVVLLAWATLYTIYSFFNPFLWKRDTVWMPGLNNVTIGGEPGLFFAYAHLGEPKVGQRVVFEGKEKNETVPENEFFYGKGLDGWPVATIALGLLLAWLIVWGNMVGGVSGSGKIAYFTALYPYIVLLVLFFTGCTLKGQRRGLSRLFIPRFDKEKVAKAVFESVGQCFFSLGISFGGCYMFASFNTFHHKLSTDIIVVSVMDTFTSILAGSCFFMFFGYLAENESPEAAEKNMDEQLKGEGAGMAFVTFPKILSKDIYGSGWSQLVSFLFFSMLVTLAVGSANGICGTVITAICDEFPKWKRKYVVTGYCIFSLFLGLLYTCPTGANLIDIVNIYGTEQVVYLLAIFETVGIVYVYGMKNLCNDFEFMLGYHPNIYWITCWAIIPPILVGIFVYYIATWKNEKFFPTVAVACGFTLTVLVLLIVPIVTVVVIQTRKSRSAIKRVKASFYPTRNWGPRDPTVREAWRRWKRTRPTEFPITTKILTALRIRTQTIDYQKYWNKPIGSIYQSTVELAADTTSIESSENVATPTTPTIATPPELLEQPREQDSTQGVEQANLYLNN